MQIMILLAVLLALGSVFFALQNTIPVTLTFFNWTLEGSLALILLITFAVGFLTSLIFSLPTIWKYKWQLSSEKNRVKVLELEQKPKKSK